MSDIVDWLNHEAAEHERFYPSDTLHGKLREAVTEIEELRNLVDNFRRYHEQGIGQLTHLLAAATRKAQA